jgi:plasmid maintenance system antidote protein VapI
LLDISRQPFVRYVYSPYSSREILRDELEELNITPTELSRQIGVPPNRVTQILHGRRDYAYYK